MTDTDIHSCGYYCYHPACILRQRDELRDKLFSEQAVKTYSGGKPNYTEPEEILTSEKNIQTSDKKETESARSWVGLTDDEIYEAVENSNSVLVKDMARSIEAKLKEKNEVSVKGDSRVVYSPDKPLSCGARVWVETEGEVEIIR